MTAHQVESAPNGVDATGTNSGIQQWLRQGEALYASAIADFQAIENQLMELEARLAEKRIEVNQIAHLIGKPPAESSRRLSAQLIDDRVPSAGSTTHIARALAGKFGR